MNIENPAEIATGFVRPNLAVAVADHLRRHLAREDARSVLPGERPLAAAMDISRPILREALAILEREGLILRRHGQPTRVAPQVNASA